MHKVLKVLMAALLIGATFMLVSPIQGLVSHCDMVQAGQQRVGCMNEGNTASGWSALGALAMYYWRGALLGPITNSVNGPEDVIVESVCGGSPAAEAGLKPGDVIIKFDSMPVTTPRSLLMAIADHPGGSVIRLLVERMGVGKTGTAVLLEVPCVRLKRQDKRPNLASYAARGGAFSTWVEKFLQALRV